MGFETCGGLWDVCDLRGLCDLWGTWDLWFLCGL